MTSPSTLSIVSGTFTGRAGGITFGVWGAVAGASATAFGTLLGGWLTTNTTWQWALYVNIQIGLIAVLGAVFRDPGVHEGQREAQL